MSEVHRADVEQTAPFPREERCHELGRVVLFGVFTSDQEAEGGTLDKARPQVVEVLLESFERDAFLWEVDLLGAGRETGHQGEVAAIAAHDLDDEATVGSVR